MMMIIIRSYGVLLWEIATFAQMPLEGKSAEDIVKMAENSTLFHPW